MPSLDAIGLIAQDIEASVNFYKELGLEPEPYEADSDHIEFHLPNGLRLMIDSVALVKQIVPDWQSPQGGHRLGLAFLCEGPAEVDRLYAHMLGSGYRGMLEPFDAFWGQRYATILDPDDNPVDLFASL